MNPVVEIKNPSYSYPGGNTALNEISFSLCKGEHLGLIGANGAGKSTLLKLMVGILATSDSVANADSIKIFNLPLHKKNLKEIRKKTGYVFQDSENQLFTASVYEDVAFGPSCMRFSSDKVEMLTRNALETTGISHLADRHVMQLSGGEKKLAAISTILSMEPELILMDEPSAALDPKNRRNLIQIINSLPQSMIIASHDLDFIYDTCRRVILISNGRLIADGTSEDILKNKELLENNSLELPLSFSRCDL